MNAVEIEEAVSALAERPFEGAEFPYQFLEAFGNKETTIKRLRAGATNKSDLGGVLQTNNIHIAVAAPGEVTKTLSLLKASPATARAKVKFVLATDGDTLEAEDIESGETIACAYTDFPNKFGFFLALAGISTVKQVRDSSFDIRATSRLNRLYVELLKDNPDWDTAARRPDMNHFLARLIFCFFAEDTDIFGGNDLFTGTIERMSAKDSSNTHEVISELFRAMNTRKEDIDAANIKRWVPEAIPYVNGGLFSGSPDVPRFSKIARSYLIHIGNLDWQKINPDIFGSMIQAVTEDEERGALGMHYTSVPNILKVLNPLFLDELRTKLQETDDNSRKLLNLRNRMARIRVFDPACGSGNFLVIAYKQMREIEAEINKRRKEEGRKSDIPLTNFRGIELRDFPAEIARLALIIAEFQCDVLYRGKQLALTEFLPLDAENWITCANALQADWLALMDVGTGGVKRNADDLFHTPQDQVQVDFKNEGGETYICGNPPYFGSKWQSAEQKADLIKVFGNRSDVAKSLDYVSGWFIKASEFLQFENGAAALVSTNSICQGQQVPLLWPLIFSEGIEISFAYNSFKWANLASNNAAVTVCIIGLAYKPKGVRKLFEIENSGVVTARVVANINGYLIPSANVVVEASRSPLNCLPEMVFGNMPRDAGHLLMSQNDAEAMREIYPASERYIRRFQGAEDFTAGRYRACIWIDESQFADAMTVEPIRKRLIAVEESRAASSAASTRQYAKKPYRFVQIQGVAKQRSIIVPRHTSENREYLPVGINPSDVIIADSALAIYDAPLWALAIIASRIHLVWISAVCGKIKTDYRYSSTLGWNNFPIPLLTETNKSELSETATEILLAREECFPMNVAALYEAQNMPSRLRAAHDANDEKVERVFAGKRLRNETEMLEVLFDRYTALSASRKHN